jgi:hypothetical protein
MVRLVVELDAPVELIDGERSAKQRCSVGPGAPYDAARGDVPCVWMPRNGGGVDFVGTAVEVDDVS